MTKDQKIHELKKEIESLNLKLKDVNLPLYDRHHLIKQIRLKEIDLKLIEMMYDKKQKNTFISFLSYIIFLISAGLVIFAIYTLFKFII